MKALWTALAQFDHARFETKKKLNLVLGRSGYRDRMEESVKDVHPPQKVIQLDA